MKRLKSLSLAASYALNYCIKHGPTSAVEAYLPHFRRQLFGFIMNSTEIQLIISNILTKKKKQITHHKKPSVLFVFVPEASSKLYRVLNQKEQLEIQGFRCNSISFWSLRLIEYLNTHDIIIFHKIPYCKVSDRITNRLHKEGKILVYDIDDLAFAPSLLKRPSPISVELTYSYRAMLMKCDYILTSTEFLAQLLRQIGKTTFVNKNCLCLKQMEASKMAIKYRQPSNRVRIGYFSGTATHDHDFLEVSDSLLCILEKFNFVDFILAGPLKLPAGFDKYKHRIKKLLFVHWSNLPFNIAKVDINIAPLEMNNIFSEGKSELKYFEAGILGIPTVASSTGVFTSIIKHGENGLLAASKNEWINCLDLLVNNEEVRMRMGKKALADVKARYNPYLRSKEFTQIIYEMFSKRGIC